MKIKILILGIFMNCIPLFAHGENTSDFEIAVIKGSKKYSFIINENLLDVSKWDGKSELSLNILDVLKLAKLALPEIYGISDKYSAESIELKKILGHEDKWYYLISYNIPFDARDKGPSLPLKVIVLLNGTILKPKTVKQM